MSVCVCVHQIKPIIANRVCKKRYSAIIYTKIIIELQNFFTTALIPTVLSLPQPSTHNSTQLLLSLTAEVVNLHNTEQEFRRNFRGQESFHFNSIEVLNSSHKC